MQDVSSSVLICVMSDIILLNVAAQKFWSCYAVGNVKVSHQTYPMFIQLDKAYTCYMIHCPGDQKNIRHVTPVLNVYCEVLVGCWSN